MPHTDTCIGYSAIFLTSAASQWSIVHYRRICVTSGSQRASTHACPRHAYVLTIMYTCVVCLCCVHEMYLSMIIYIYIYIYIYYVHTHIHSIMYLHVHILTCTELEACKYTRAHTHIHRHRHRHRQINTQHDPAYTRKHLYSLMRLHDTAH
jgi:hypothetical protein